MTWWLICWNCPSRSGWWLPSFVLRLTWREYPRQVSILPTVLAQTEWFKPRRAVASFSRLFETHSSGRIGSPMVAGSTNRRRSSSTVGSALLDAGTLAPHPVRRRWRCQKILGPANDRAVRDARRPRHRRGPAIAGSNFLRGHEQAATSFVQPVLDGYVASAYRGFVDHPGIVHRTAPRRNPPPVEMVNRVGYSCASPKKHEPWPKKPSARRCTRRWSTRCAAT